jgi:GTP-binding protein YchF
LELGIIGLPGSGKSTVFRALTGGAETSDRKSQHEPGLAAVKVDDARLDFLAAHYKAKKTTQVEVEYLDIAGITGEGKPGREIGERVLAHIRNVDALIEPVRFFDSSTLGPAEPLKDLAAVEEEMILSDLAIVEKRIERIARDMKKGRKELADELALLEQARSLLNEGKPLRVAPESVESEMLKGFAFLSSKPTLFLVNAGENKTLEQVLGLAEEIRHRTTEQKRVAVDWLYADTEAEIARLDAADAAEFLKDLGLEEGAKNRIIKRSFELLRLIVFFTVSEKEVRAWPFRKGEAALAAAGAVHSDMQRGFIRAEVIPFDEFKAAGSIAAAKKAGKVRLEGKEYRVNDGDVIQFLFNV